MHTRIIVAHPRHHADYAGHEVAWIYADEKLACHEQIRASLGYDRLLITPRRFQEEAQRLVLDFIPWADEQIPIDDPLEWLLTPLHRNPFFSNLVLHLFWMRLLAVYGEGREVVVFTESSGLARACADHCRNSGWDFIWKGKLRFFLHELRIMLRSAAKLVYDILRSYVGWLCARMILGRKYIAGLRSSELLIDAYLYTDSISAGGGFTDKHLPGLAEWYRERGISTAIYPFPVGIPLYQFPRLFRQMKTCTVPMLPFELLLNLGDIPHAAYTCLRRGLRAGGRHHFAGIEVTALVAGERFRAAATGMLPLLLAVAPPRLGQCGVNPRWFLDWYENQPIDRANAIGFASAGCRVVAMRLYSLYPMFASLFTTEREVLAAVCPLEAWVSGKALEGQLSRYDRQTKYHRVPALRYGHLYAQNADDNIPPAGGRSLLLLLTHSAEESTAILDCVLNALALLPDCTMQVIVKPHPDFGVFRLQELVATRWPWALKGERIKWESGSLATVLSSADLIVSAGTSAAIEAVCRGIPVILVGRKAGLDMNPLAEMDGRLWEMVYEAEELAAVLRKWAPFHPLSVRERLAIGEESKRGNYEPSTPRLFELFGSLLREEPIVN